MSLATATHVEYVYGRTRYWKQVVDRISDVDGFHYMCWAYWNPHGWTKDYGASSRRFIKLSDIGPLL